MELVPRLGDFESRGEFAYTVDRAIRSCTDGLHKKFYELCYYLSLVKEHGLWKELGATSFTSYVNALNTGLRYDQLRLGMRVVEKVFANERIRGVVERALAGRGDVDIESLPPSKLDDIIPALTKLVESGDEQKAQELVVAVLPPPEGLSRTDLQMKLEEEGFKEPVRRRYLCLRGVSEAVIVETDSKESLLGQYDIIVVEPRFVKRGPVQESDS
jgi:hypothetical protein